MHSEECYDVVIIGGGIAGLKSANELAKMGIDFHLIEASDHIGGRISTEVITNEKQPQPYKFELGAAFIHGTHESLLLNLFQSLFEKQHPEQSFEDQLCPVFNGNFWLHPEFIPSPEMSIVDGLSGNILTAEQYQVYQHLTVLHLRPLLRIAHDLDLGLFHRIYCDFIAQLPLPHAAIYSRAISWYFHSIECYNGPGIGTMVSSDLFSTQDQPLAAHIASLQNTSAPSGSFTPSFPTTPEMAPYLGLFTAAVTQSAIDIALSASTFDLSLYTTDYLSTETASADATIQGCALSSHCVVKCGMGKLVELLASDIQHTLDTSTSTDIHDHQSRTPPISLNTRVTQVEFIDGQPVLYTNTNRRIRARYGIICTVSMASLQKYNFFPPQTRAFQSTQRLLKTALPVYYRKVLFAFEHRWWPDTAKIIALTQSCGDSRSVGDTNGGVSRHNIAPTSLHDVSGGLYPSLFQHIGSFPEQWINTRNRDDPDHLQLENSRVSGCHLFFESHYPTKGANVLSCSVVGDLAELFVGKSDSFVCNFIFAHLQQLYQSFQRPHSTTEQDTHESFVHHIPMPLWTRVTHWAETADVMQSYSLVVDCDDELDERVSYAEADHVWFAGEALDSDNAGSIHAALTSADAAVKRITQLYQLDH